MSARLLRAWTVVDGQQYGSQCAHPVIQDDLAIADFVWRRAKADAVRTLLDLPAVDAALQAGEELEIRVQVIEQNPIFRGHLPEHEYVGPGLCHWKDTNGYECCRRH